MPNEQISDFDEGTDLAATDEFPAVDKSDTADAPTGTTKRFLWSTIITKLFGSRFGADAGASDTYVVTLVPAPASYITGEHYRFKANTANTGACTVDFNSLGAKTIKKAAGGITTDLATNDIRAGQWVDLVYDGTNMQMQSLLGNAPAGGTGGIGDVVGPASATDNAIAVYDSTTGKLIKNSVVIVSTAGAITVPEVSAPSTPAAGTVHIYAKSDGLLYSKDDAGVETLVSGGTGGSIAPLVVEGVNEIAQRNGATGQQFNVYGAYTSGSNYKRLRIGWSGGGNPEIFSESATIGSTNIVLRVGNTSADGINIGATAIAPVTDVGMNLGDSSHYFGEIYNRDFIAKSGGMFRLVGGSRLKGPASGILNIIDDSGNSGSGTIRFDNRTPSQITSNQNNYSVPVTGYFIRLSTDASRDITGLTFGGGGVGDGQVHLLVNVGTNPIVLKHDDANSTAGNRFYCSTGADITLTSTATAKQAAEVIYDATLSRWLVYKRS